jgi:hypothetical protein
MSGNSVATASDFRQAAEASAFEDPERVVLPKCGLAVILRRPRPIAFTLLGGALPQSLGNRESGVGGRESEVGARHVVPVQESDPTPYTPQELIEVSRFWTKLFKAIFVQPGLSTTPGPEEIHPGWIPVDDQVFLIRWAVGEIVSDGGAGARHDVPLQFPDGRSAADGPGGGDVELPPKRAADGDNKRVAD